MVPFVLLLLVTACGTKNYKISDNGVTVSINQPDASKPSRVRLQVV